MTKQKQAKNTFKEIFSYKVFGGMKMATISVHEDDFGTGELKDNEDMGWNNVRVEICVGGECVSTTLKNIIKTIRNTTMTKQKQLKKLIEIAIERGWKPTSFVKSDSKIDCLLFNHDFAKAIWGEEDIECFCEGCRQMNFCTSYDGNGVWWQYHLQQAVISKDVIQYYYDNAIKNKKV